MILQKMKIGDSCLLYAAAMVLDIPASALVKEIGHDGSEVWFPEYDKPERGINIQEIVDACFAHGKSLTPVHRYPANSPDGDAHRPLWPETVADNRFFGIISGFSGILIGLTANGVRHSCAWDSSIIYDPRGYQHGLSDYSKRMFEITECWVISNLS